MPSVFVFSRTVILTPSFRSPRRAHSDYELTGPEAHPESRVSCRAACLTPRLVVVVVVVVLLLLLVLLLPLLQLQLLPPATRC